MAKEQKLVSLDEDIITIHRGMAYETTEDSSYVRP